MTRTGVNLALCPDEAVAQHGDYVQLLHGTRAWTSTEVRDASRRLAGALVELGLLPGDRVITLLPNRPEVFVVFFAVWRAGATCVPVLARMTAAELASRIAHSGAKAIVTAAELHAKVRDALAALASTRPPQVVVLDGPAAAPAHAFDDLIRTGRAIAPVPSDPDALALVMYTGGTAGAPKGAMITHRGLDATTRYVAEGLDRPIALLAIPLAHIAGICWGLGYLRKGGRAILFDAFDAAALLRSIHEHRVQVIPGAPWMFWALATHPDAKRHDTSSMRLWVYASAPMPLHQVEAFEATFRTRLHTVYGLTEASGGVTRTAPDQPRKPGSVGRVQPGAPHELRIAGEDGRPLPPGEVGEIMIRGVAVSPGYLRLPDETAATFRGGWLATGDLGWQDADGDVFLAGRKKELIISAGFNVYPAEVEGAIAALPGVHAVAVIGVPDPELGERPMAFVAPVRGSGLSRDDVVRHCVRRLTSYKVPAVQLVDRLPLMDTGKVDKRRLAELAPRRGGPGEAPPARGGQLGRSDLRRRIEARLRVLLDAPPDARLAPDRPLMELGLDSLRAVQLRDELADELELRGLAPTLAIDHPTIDALVEHVLRLRSPAAAAERVAAERAAAERAPAPAAAPDVAPRVVPLAAPPPVVCVHPAAVAVAAYAELARRLAAAGHATLAIEDPRRAGDERSTLEALAREHARLLAAAVPRGPYRLLGWSAGGALAHAIAAELERAGAEVELLAVIDPPAAAPDAGVDPLELRLASLGDAAAEQRILLGGHLALARRYRPGPVRAAMLAVVPAHHAASARNLDSWPAWSAAPPTVLAVDGDHFSILRAPGLDAWLPALLARLSAPSPAERPPR